MTDKPPNSRQWNDRIAWLLRDAPAELGEQGQSIDPAGGGARTIADTGPMHDRALSAMRAVKMWRELSPVFFALDPVHQKVLRARYEQKQVWQVRGIQAVFGDLASVALLLTDDRELLLFALSDAQNSKHVPYITVQKRMVKRAVEAAHAAWDKEYERGSPAARVYQGAACPRG